MKRTEEIYKLFKQHPTISTDSRNISENSIFFALHGDSFDGNNYALETLEKGAKYAVVDNAEIADKDERLILVDDTLKALQTLAQRHRQELAIPIIAITGSNGKTTSKELLYTSLSAKYNVSATKGNLNNHIGVPLTLLSMDDTTQLGIVEMGASAQGEIALLCEIAEPNFGVITNIGEAHLEGFGGTEGVRKGKGELFDFLSKHQGVAFVPAQDEVILSVSKKYPALKTIEYQYDIANGVEHKLEGVYNLKNIATAMNAASYFEVEPAKYLDAIANYTPTNNRSQRVETQHNSIIVDCYNANPSSMRASITNFAQTQFGMGERTKLLILGDMLELGDWSKECHIEIIELADSLQSGEIWLVGAEFSSAYNDSKITNAKLFASKEELLQHAENHPIKNRAILLKGSRGIGLERLLEKL